MSDEKNFEKEFKSSIDRYRIEEKEQWRQWCDKIPFIPFPDGWQIQIIPPFVGAMARFRVRLPQHKEGDSVSIYLDCFDRLGFFGEPYWEVYPYQGDTGRCPMADVKTLIEMIADREERKDDSDE